MTKILVPVEDRTYGKAQIEFLSKHELPEKAEFTLMTVLKPLAVQDYGFAVPAAYLEAIVKEDEKCAKKLISEMEELLKQKFPKNKVSKLIEMGSPAGEILREAKEGNHDWIVLGSHGRSGLDKFFLGSVSQSVANHAGCTVTIVRLPQPAKTNEEKTREVASTAKG